MHFMITGHTGFKGTWLALMLKDLGHEVSGYSLEPRPHSIFNHTNASSIFERDVRADIRDIDTLKKEMALVDPDFVFHLAAQPIVRYSYTNPRETFETNVMGTLNVLEASQFCNNLKGQLVITTDKVYKDVGKEMGYVESDPLGGHDPYSASKAMADILTQSWISSFSNQNTGIARAGNVIGGGDDSLDRLLPDVVRSLTSNTMIRLRNPKAVRPWQHVLDCLNGYVMFSDAICSGRNPVALNFGPPPQGFATVEEVVQIAKLNWPSENEVTSEVQEENPVETHFLTLNSKKANEVLAWSNKLSIEKSITWTLAWEKELHNKSSMREFSLSQISEFNAI